MDIEELQRRAGITEGDHFAKSVWAFERALSALIQSNGLDTDGLRMAHDIETKLTKIKRELRVP